MKRNYIDEEVFEYLKEWMFTLLKYAYFLDLDENEESRYKKFSRIDRQVENKMQGNSSKLSFNSKSRFGNNKKSNGFSVPPLLFWCFSGCGGGLLSNSSVI